MPNGCWHDQSLDKSSKRTAGYLMENNMSRELLADALPWLIAFYGFTAAAAGYWFGEQSAYKSLGYGSETTFASVGHWFSSWLPNLYYWVNRSRDPR